MKKMGRLDYFTSLVFILNLLFIYGLQIDSKLTRIWGPGLSPNKIILPARYFFIQAVDNNNNSINHSLEEPLQVVIEGSTNLNKQCRIWSNVLDRKDGSYIVRYKMYETCSYLSISVKYRDKLIGESPYIIHNKIYSDECKCPVKDLKGVLNELECGSVPKQIINDLKQFESINWNHIRQKLIEEFNKPHSVSLCHYVIKDNEIYRKCYGKYVGFNMFMDNILLSLTRKAHVPNLEFFVNLGDWPLINKDSLNVYPVFSWCGSKDTFDIVLPTYDITESTLENMGRVMLDMLSVQGNIEKLWEERVPKLFWRGRDSNRHRLDLIKIAKEHPDLFNASLTNFFFYRDEQDVYGPKSEHISFFKFFNYKYQLAIDGTVAAYRMPYLLGGASLVFKPDSKYYEHFYNDLEPYVHYVPVKKDLSDLVEKIKWAINNDEQAKKIARNGQHFANENLLPKDIICYHMQLLNEFSRRIISEVSVLEDMEHIKQTKDLQCDCNDEVRDEL